MRPPGFPQKYEDNAGWAGQAYGDVMKFGKISKTRLII